MSSYFFLQAPKNSHNASALKKLEAFAETNKQLIYILDRPLADTKYAYSYSKAFIILSPKRKIAIVNYGKDGEEFEEYVEDIIEDLGSISDKYQYKEVIGRPRKWRMLCSRRMCI